MKFNNRDDDDEKDFFDGPDIEEKKREPKPHYRPDDPKYWEREPSQWAHLRPRRNRRFWFYLIGAAVVIAFLVALYMRFFTPYVTDAVQYGYVESIEKRGYIFKTEEGVLIPYKALMDSTRPYNRDFTFTAATPKVAAALRAMQFDAQPVRIEYKEYHATVPWRGASKRVVTAVDSVDPRKILPPDFTPAYVRSGGLMRDTADATAIRLRHEALEEMEE